jgi:hypothetical protein
MSSKTNSTDLTPESGFRVVKEIGDMKILQYDPPSENKVAEATPVKTAKKKGTKFT